jgi:hypothetical protein
MRHPILLSIFLLLSAFALKAYGQNLQINDLEYFEDTGINVLVYSNNYAGMFCDEKTAAIELILRGERISTGGGIRLMNTPEQWDIFPDLVNRTVNRADNSIELELKYNDYDFTSRIKVTSYGKGVRLVVYLDKPVPEKLVGRAGLNWEFFPASFFGKTYMMDGQPGILPMYPADNTHMLPRSEKIEQFYGLSTFDDRGLAEFVVPHPFSKGNTLVFAPEDPDLRVSISSQSEINLFDGRNLAQNGTFVVRSFLPGNKTGEVLEWYIEPSYDPNWVREPNIGFSQIGYTPAQKKVAVAELDKNASPVETADIIRVSEKGEETVVCKAEVKPWGTYNNRYNYATIDFSEVREPGLYCIKLGESKTNVFPVNKDVYQGKWHLSMDVFLPVHMDHMEVNEGYRTWHGRSHMDDALQAPVNYEQFDGYRQGPVTHTKYESWEHIPGLAVGGWYDAGDFDIQSRTVVSMTSDLVTLWDLFTPERDQTFIDQETQFVDIHRPDGMPDVIQQIQHGVLNIIAQVENIGFVAQGIVQSNMYQYHHLGDAATITDGLIYDPSLNPYQSEGRRSGTRDDRVAFTGNFSPAGTMSTVASLASAARVLKPYYPELAERALKNALMLWDKYFEDADPAKATNRRMRWFRGDSRISAAVELWKTTGETGYKDFFEDAVIKEMEPVEMNFPGAPSGKFYNLGTALSIYPLMDKDFQDKVKEIIPEYVESIKENSSQTPYGVPISGRGWGGNDQVIRWAYSNYLVWKYFPEMIDPELVLLGLHYLFGCHPYSNVSFITSVGVNTKKVAYGNNRADYTVIPGGVIPGLLLLAPDYMENKDDYPFLWGENECCTNSIPNFVMLSLAAEEVAAAMNK